MTATYNATDNTLTELPGLDKPEQYFFSHKFAYEDAVAYYNDHVSQLRTIPAHESARSLWKDKQKVEEGKDYEVMEEDNYVCHHCHDQGYKSGIEYACRYCNPDGSWRNVSGRPKGKKLTAFPLPVKGMTTNDWMKVSDVPVKSEGDLWYKVIDLIMVAHDKGLSKEDAIGVVKSQYIITKR